MESILGYALGDIPADLAQDLTITLPEMYLPGWSAREVATSTDGLLAAAGREDRCPWTTLLVTSWLDGGTSLAKTLETLRNKWPHLRIAVLLGADVPEYRPLVARLAAYRIWNILISDEFQFDDLVSLVTTDWPWEQIQPFLDSPDTMSAPRQATLPSRVEDHRRAPEDPKPSLSVAVVSAKGGAGKTGIIANALWASQNQSRIAIDLDVRKASLPLYFRSADNPYDVHLHQLLTLLSRPAGAGWAEDDRRDRLTPQDKEEIRAYVHRAVEVAPGARLVLGPNREQVMEPVVPPGLAAELIRQAKRTAQTVWVDLPAAIHNPIWEEAVRTVDHVLVVTTPDPLAVLETIALFQHLDRLRVPRSAIRLIVNRAGHGGLPAVEIATVHVHHPLLLAIPDQTKLWDTAFLDHRPVAHRQPKVWKQLVRAFEPTDDEPAPQPTTRRNRRRAPQPVS